MNYAAIYSVTYAFRNLVRRVAKLFVWLYGIQAGILFGLAAVADQPMPFTSSPAIYFAGAMAAFFLVPRTLDAVLRNIAAAARMRQA